ncbi:MraY family glycosyltransferase [Thermocrinis minervae]|uniref:UDP-N-acetylmuramyl pentapeptide phosphotransferase/UDP-N-acetylglucosamine-1-phosphate transferase n=1 Tax=Thermocrinis minervae TaxID=381751 RepID=A0A1M6SAK0_9AQUI|nr:glycosyltransferase [Thermocrinis minervae]SHK41659.1 UDP-N-acetylmuramyl pentapeptide phosphotransferase/UDP-N-acetylglucosamine-1-phosphate transferase [Thermocrinis minervae]
MPYLILAFFVSFLLSLFFIRLNLAHDPTYGVQKFHKRPTPRLGGLAIMASLILVTFSFYWVRKDFSREYFLAVLSSLPVFTAGFVEDITRKVGPKVRLLAGFLSGAALVLLLKAWVSRVDVAPFDYLLSIYPVAFLFTAFAVSGLCHAFNIIDGFNGLASGVAMMNFLAYSYVSFLHNDYFLLYLSLSAFSATLGFFLWNYPFGLIFLGDSGAYLLGFLNGLIGILLTHRYADVSPWFVMLLLIYPVWETLFSIYRRKFLRGSGAMHPDTLHLHSLLYKRLSRSLLGTDADSLLLNSQTSPFIWSLHLLCVVPALFFWNRTPILILFVLLFIVLYTWLYFRIVRFKTPFVRR